MGVARQIGEHLLRARRRALGVDEPVGLAQRRQEGGEGARVGERRHASPKNCEPAGGMRRGQLRQEQPAEQAREHAHGQEEAGPA